MNSLQFSLLPHNPFIRPAFWGRRDELKVMYHYLLSEPPRCCAVIGEDTFGKTTLLRYLSDSQDAPVLDALQLKDELKHYVFVYLKCTGYGDEMADLKEYASARFWWDLYSRTWRKLEGDADPPLSEPKLNAKQEYIDVAVELRWELESLIQGQHRKVVFVLDNFEGVAHLDLRDSEWLRSMSRVCTYIVASRDRLYLLYHPTSWSTPSPLWNLFADPIYLGLLTEDEVKDILCQASEQARARNSIWKQDDIDYIHETAGRHPELLRIACAYMFEYRLHNRGSLTFEKGQIDTTYLEYSIHTAARPVCAQLWQGLARPELLDEPGALSTQREATASLSLHQRALLDIAKGANGTRKEPLAELDLYERHKILFSLEQRGLIEFREGAWRVFSEVMRRFVLKQELLASPTVPVQAAVSSYRHEGLTYQEQRVYDYLRLHMGEVCSREDIKRAVWQNNEPTDSALQKIVERIRLKIEPYPDNPRYLLAVRGRGYILNEKTV
jgi:hypothetical protein